MKLLLLVLAALFAASARASSATATASATIVPFVRVSVAPSAGSPTVSIRISAPDAGDPARPRVVVAYN